MKAKTGLISSKLSRCYCKSCGRHYIVTMHDRCGSCDEKLIPYERQR